MNLPTTTKTLKDKKVKDLLNAVKRKTWQTNRGRQ